MAPWKAFLRSILGMQIGHHVLHAIKPAELPPTCLLHRADGLGVRGQRLERQRLVDKTSLSDDFLFRHPDQQEAKGI